MRRSSESTKESGSSRPASGSATGCDRTRLPVAAHLQLERVARSFFGKQRGESLAVGDGHSGGPQNHITRLEARGRGGRARSGEPHPQSLGHRLEGEFTEIGPAILLVVEATAGQFDPFHGRPAAGERDEHPGGILLRERSEREPPPLGRLVRPGLRGLGRVGGKVGLGGLVAPAGIAGSFLPRSACRSAPRSSPRIAG